MTAERPQPEMGHMFPMVVEASHVMQFARAIGDTAAEFENPTVRHSTDPEVAPPTFRMAADHFNPDYVRRPRAGVPWITAHEPHPYQPTGFHAEQHFAFHRPIRVGDVLTVSER